MGIPATKENIAQAKRFLKRKWKDRAAEYGRSPPKDLSGSCKFAALFARALFGGDLRGNWHHVYVVKNGAVIDLTGGAGVEKQYLAVDDRRFFRDPSFQESLGFCEPRVNQWVQEFMGKKGGKS